MAHMPSLQLSQFPLGKQIRLTIKNSKGLEKCIRLGAFVYKSPSLTIIMDQENPGNLFKFFLRENGRLLLSQAPDGNIILSVSQNLTIPCIPNEPPGDYLKVSVIKRRNKKSDIITRYVSLQSRG